MELPGNVAVIDGRIFPVSEWYVEEDYDSATVSNTVGQRLGAVVTNKCYKGEIEILASSLPSSMTMYPMHDIYLFPESGTKNRMFLVDAMFESVYCGEKMSTTRIEFIAKHMKR